MAICVRIKLYADFAWPTGYSSSANFDDTGRTAYSNCCGRCADLHVASLGDRTGDEGHCAFNDLKRRYIMLAAFLINKIVV